MQLAVLTLVVGLVTPSVISLRTFTLEELVPMTHKFYPERLSVQWISESEYIFTDPEAGIKKYDAATNTTTTLLDDVDLAGLGQHSPSTFSSDGKYVLATANRRKVYRYSSFAEYFVYNISNKYFAQIGHGPLQVVVWSPDNAIAIVEKNNVFYIQNAGSGKVFQLTTSGIPGQIYNGVTDWIYEEEIFNSAEAMWFSKGGTYLAVASFNDTLVESATFQYYGKAATLESQYPQEVHFKYPKAGRTNPEVKLTVYNVRNLSEPPRVLPYASGLGSDVILGRVTWASDNTLLVLWLNRRQNQAVLVSCCMMDKKCLPVKDYKEPNGWVDITTPVVDSTGSKLLEIQPVHYEDRRFMHLTRQSFDSNELKDLTPSNSTVTNILGWDEVKGVVYFELSPASEPWQRQLWMSHEGNMKCVSCGLVCGNAASSFAPGGKYAIVSCSSTNVPLKVYLFKSQDQSFRLIKDNARLLKRLAEYSQPMPLFSVVPLESNLVAHVKLMLPPNIRPGEKLPMVVRVYAGPGSSRVRDNFDLDYGTYLSTNRSFIVASIDVRGSDVMGVDAMHAVNNALGTVEVEDTLKTIKRLVELYSFIDGSRVGVWGWSYGGFTTAMMLIKDDQKTLACGAAVAPVTSWLYYDTMYTERYMGTPQANPDGYGASDLMVHVSKLQGKSLLLIHGSADDNVHYQNSMMLAKALQQADIPFEQMSYTDQNHSLLGVTRHFYHTLDRFWTECFHR